MRLWNVLKHLGPAAKTSLYFSGIALFVIALLLPMESGSVMMVVLKLLIAIVGMAIVLAFV